MPVDQLVDLGTAVAGVIPFGAADIVLVKLLTGAAATGPATETRRQTRGCADRDGLAILSLPKEIPAQSVAFV